MAPLVQVADEDRRESGIAAGGGHAQAVADAPDDESRNPLLQAEADRSGERTVDDRDATGCAAQQDRRPEAPMDRNLEAFDLTTAGSDRLRHAISAPPPKLKKLRKKLDAAKAIDRPKTI